MEAINTMPRAEQLIARERVEEFRRPNAIGQHGICKRARTVLRTHKKPSKRCGSLRTRHSLPAGLAAAARIPRATSSSGNAKREPKRRALWAACAVSWVFGSPALPMFGVCSSGSAERTGVPKLSGTRHLGCGDDSRAVRSDCFVDGESAARAAEPDWMRQSK